MMQSYGELENLTLSGADLQDMPRGGPRPYGSGKLRAYCPVHGGDNQRSLEVNLQSGRFHCHNCKCWGYMDWAREEYRRERKLAERGSSFGGAHVGGRPSQGFAQRRVIRKPPPPPPVEPVRDDLEELLARFQAALEWSWGSATCYTGASHSTQFSGTAWATRRLGSGLGEDGKVGGWCSPTGAPTAF
jgi:hypothetical protein